MKILTNHEENIVLATLYLQDVNADKHFVPDYEICENSFGLSMEEMRDIRDIVQKETWKVKTNP
jgi:hypothetical protein